ncbi:hypothetical protein Lal_00023179 [Lupinus albus]|nr:hypothetical protein Lal_00023179 [Lupinus albus]
MPKTKPMDIISYVTIRGTNKVVRVGDCVLMRSVDGSNRLRVAQVEWIDQDDDYNMNVHLIWYCKPEESYGGRRQFHGARELFLTDQYSAQSADTIHGKCNVHSFENYNELRNINAWDYYSRFHYSVSTGVFTPDQIRIVSASCLKTRMNSCCNVKCARIGSIPCAWACQLDMQGDWKIMCVQNVHLMRRNETRATFPESSASDPASAAV